MRLEPSSSESKKLVDSRSELSMELLSYRRARCRACPFSFSPAVGAAGHGVRDGHKGEGTGGDRELIYGRSTV